MGTRGVLTVILLVLWVQDAAAFFGSRCVCDPTDDDAAQATRVIQNMTVQLTALEVALVAALKLHATQVSGMITQNANAHAKALDGANKVQAELLRDVEESRAVREHAPSETVCEGITGMSGLAPGRAQQVAVAQARSAETVGRMLQDPSVIVVSAEPGDTRARYERVVQLYCDPTRMAGTEDVCSGSADLHGADLHPGALLGHSTLEDGTDRDTAVDWTRNVAVPVAWDRMPYREARSTAGRRRVLRERSLDARGALAAGYLNDLFAMRVPAVALGDWAREVMPAGTGPVGDSLSHYELLEVLTHRFEAPDYFLKLQAQGEANLLRELVQLRAVGLMLDWESYRVGEWNAAMTAALLALETERDRALGQGVGG